MNLGQIFASSLGAESLGGAIGGSNGGSFLDKALGGTADALEWGNKSGGFKNALLNAGGDVLKDIGNGAREGIGGGFGDFINGALSGENPDRTTTGTMGQVANGVAKLALAGGLSVGNGSNKKQEQYQPNTGAFGTAQPIQQEEPRRLTLLDKWKMKRGEYNA